MNNVTFQTPQTTVHPSKSKKNRLSILFGDDIAIQALNYHHALSVINQIRPLTPGDPIPQNMARALMPRQPYSEAVPSTE